jgi:hypothetical protein
MSIINPRDIQRRKEAAAIKAKEQAQEQAQQVINERAESILEDMVTAGVVSVVEPTPIVATIGLGGSHVTGETDRKYHYSPKAVNEFIQKDFGTRYANIDILMGTFETTPTYENLEPAFQLIQDAKETYSALAASHEWAKGVFIANEDEETGLLTWLRDIPDTLREKRKSLEATNDRNVMALLEGAEDLFPEERKAKLASVDNLIFRTRELMFGKERIDPEAIFSSSSTVRKKQDYLKNIKAVTEAYHTRSPFEPKFRWGERNQYHDLLGIDRKEKQSEEKLAEVTTAKVFEYLKSRGNDFVPIEDLRVNVFVKNGGHGLLYHAIGNVVRTPDNNVVIEYENTDNCRTNRARLRMRFRNTK